MAYHEEDLVLGVGMPTSTDWDDEKYDDFLDRLCGGREYQKEAIKTALRYLLGNEYENLGALALANWDNAEKQPTLMARYGNKDNFLADLVFSEKLSASLDLATGTGKSYILYALAVILLNEKIVDQVLVLCPSTTIETGLMEKFRTLATDDEISSGIVGFVPPRVINGTESVVKGCICVENYHQILGHATSSIRASLRGKGRRTLVLNDEMHHVLAGGAQEVRQWREFLLDPDFNFRYIVGCSGTCYVGNNYFSDVIYRYSLRSAMEDGVIKRVDYVTDTGSLNWKRDWYIAAKEVQEHLEEELRPLGILPLTIVVTQTTKDCNRIAEDFKKFLRERNSWSEEQVDEKVAIIHSRSTEVGRLKGVDSTTDKIEYIFSVSMLTEGWDVKRVFQIVPHEERAFNSKLLISQVMGRGLRVPEKWPKEAKRPEVTILNHPNWGPQIKRLVDELLEFDRRISSRHIDDAGYDLTLDTIEYDRDFIGTKLTPVRGRTKLFEKGFVEVEPNIRKEEVETTIAREALIDGVGLVQDIKIAYARKYLEIDEVVNRMFGMFENWFGEDEKELSYWQKRWPIEKLREVVEGSLEKANSNLITEKSFNMLLQAMNVINQREIKTGKLAAIPQELVRVSTRDVSAATMGSVTADTLSPTHNAMGERYLYYTEKSAEGLSDEEGDIFEEVTNRLNGYRVAKVESVYWKTPYNLILTDSRNEATFIENLVAANNTPAIDAWLKSNSSGFYGIEYHWRSVSHHTKYEMFNPDFFIKVCDRIIVVEVKDDSEIANPDCKNILKNKAAIPHFERVNDELAKKRVDYRYKFTFITPSDFDGLFEVIRGKNEGKIDAFRSKLDDSLVKRQNRCINIDF